MNHRHLAVNLFVLLGIPIACVAGYLAWSVRQPVVVGADAFLEPAVTPELEVDGREPYRYTRFNGKLSEHP